ncbi:hypothetical protein MJ863_13095 [Alcaligenes ammonioxydans]|uniref:hypothetical protein n=1 Tax=Alcaligenes ammonioxydans TaxID=2582914 RepID=UPI001F06C056|nr:hypothetical protein [Alcaligenes ammonioxydans]MCH1880521.1 hypothetical protein [Alcaligenes ammonioxydans]
MQHVRRFTPRTLLGSLMLGMALLSGCASTGSSLLSGAQADDRLTSGQDAKFFSRSGFQACAGAAAVGVLACMLSNSSNKAACAIIAGVAACGVAMGTNYYLDQRRTEYANTTERLAAMQRDVEADTANILERTRTAQQVIADDKRQIADIEKHMKAKTMEKKQAEKQLARIDKNIEVLNRDLKNMTEKVSLYRDVADAERKDGGKKAEVQRLDRQIDEMNVKVAVLQKEVDDLYSMRSAVTLG